VEADRRHPVKRLRPVPSGEVSIPAAVATAVVLGASAVALAFLRNPELGVTIVAYLAVQAAYATGLKDQPALDLAAISSGFLLRAIAGGVAAGLAMSPWFLLVATFGSLFMVAGKRYSEMRRLGSSSGTRRSLESYSESYLRFIWSMAAGVTVVVYCLWVMAALSPGSGPPWALLSLAPFVLGLLRYAADIDRGTAESPEDIVLADRHLQVIGLAWLVLVVLHAASH
jgi:decaprenyl-phosphate phosphoribosyltransferase